MNFKVFVIGLSLFSAVLSCGHALAEDMGADSSVDSIVVKASEAPAVEPETMEEAVKLVVKAFDLALAGQWLLLAILLIQLGVFGVKKYAPDGYMKVWGSITVGAMAACIAFLSSLLGGLSWQEALVVFLSGPASSLCVDLLHALGWLKRKA